MAENIDWETIYDKSEMYSGADIANVVKEASYIQMRNKIRAEGGIKNANKNI